MSSGRLNVVCGMWGSKPNIPPATYDLLFSHRSFFNALLVSGALENTFHINARSDNAIGIEAAELNQFLHLRDGHIRRRGHHGVKVSGCLSVNKVPPPVALPRFDESVVSLQAALQKIFSAVELAHFLAFGDNSAHARWRKKAGDPRATRPDALGKRALRNQFQFYLALQRQIFEGFVFSHISSDYFPDLPGCKQ